MQFFIKNRAYYASGSVLLGPLLNFVYDLYNIQTGPNHYGAALKLIVFDIIVR